MLDMSNYQGNAMTYHLMPIRMVVWKGQETTSVGEYKEKGEALYTVSGNINWCNHYRKQYGDAS